MSGILLARRHGGAKTEIVLPAIGAAWLGGYFVGVIDPKIADMSANEYYTTPIRSALISAPAAYTARTIFNSTQTASPPQTWTRWNGLGATLAMVAAGDHAAAASCNGRSFPDDGASQWYMPAMDELELIYRNLKPTTDLNSTAVDSGSSFPGGTQTSGVNPSSSPQGSAYTTGNPAQSTVAIFRSGGAEAWTSAFYWSSTEYNATGAWTQSSTNGLQFRTRKAGPGVDVRPVRRFVF